MGAAISSTAPITEPPTGEDFAFRFLSLPRELRQMILYYAITNELTRIDEEILSKPVLPCECGFDVCQISGMAKPLSQDIAKRYERVRRLTGWVREVCKDCKELEGDFDDAYSSWVMRLGWVSQGGKATKEAKETKGRRAFLDWVYETAGCAVMIE